MITARLVAILALGCLASSQGKLFEDEGTLSSFDPWATTTPYARFSQIAFGDVDGDGDIDMVYGGGANGVGNPTFYIAENTGGGTFAPSLKPPVPSQVCYGGYGSLRLVDLDGDGDLDLVASCSVAPPPICPASHSLRGVAVWENDGTGRFTVSTKFSLPPVDNCLAIGVADLDGDGDIDIVAGRYGMTDLILLNDGKGRFTASNALQYGVIAGATSDVAIGDLNRDGRPDIVCANSTNPGTMWLSSQNGGYVETVLQSLFSVLTVDLDGDGFVELVVGDFARRTSVIYTCGAAGKLTEVATVGSFGGARAGDVDQDGRVDLLFGSYLFANQGGFRFVDVTSQWIDLGRSVVSWPEVHDIDNDGDPDIVGMGLATSPVSNQKYDSPVITRNRRRHLSGPLQARVGWTLTLRTYADHLRLVTLGLSLGESTIPFGSAGVFRLD
ncbi:MAG: VCBS repeat-containing protein, partial [Acidimicrobiia bacterium]|nr:VCBS repeat-containing protein [Acidimicrobiia bacterium]